MTRLYAVTDLSTGYVIRYVRAATLNSAIRAVADERFAAAPMSADAVYAAMRQGADVLDVVGAAGSDDDDEDSAAHEREVSAAKERLVAAPITDELSVTAGPARR